MDYKVKENIDWRLVQRLSFFSLISIVLILIASFFFSSLLVPILISFFFAYLLAPLIDYCDRLPVPRGVVSAGVIFLLVLLITLISSRVFPMLYWQVINLLDLAPRAVQTITTRWIPTLRTFFEFHEIFDRETFDQMVANASLMTQVTEKLQQAITSLWNTAPEVLGTVVNYILVPPLTFFVLKDLPSIKRHFRSLIPRDLQRSVAKIVIGINNTLRSVIKGQVMVAAILAFLYLIGLNLVGLQSATAIALVAGLCRLVPYLDVIVGGALSIIVLVSHSADASQIFAVAGVFLLVQSVDGMFITPRVVGDRVGLHPMLVILSIFAFADALGIGGVLIAIPVVALVRKLWLAVIPFYLGSSAYDLAKGVPAALPNKKTKK